MEKWFVRRCRRLWLDLEQSCNLQGTTMNGVSLLHFLKHPFVKRKTQTTTTLHCKGIWDKIIGLFFCWHSTAILQQLQKACVFALLSWHITNELTTCEIDISLTKMNSVMLAVWDHQLDSDCHIPSSYRSVGKSIKNPTILSLDRQDCYLEQQFVLKSGHLECAGVETA